MFNRHSITVVTMRNYKSEYLHDERYNYLYPSKLNGIVAILCDMFHLKIISYKDVRFDHCNPDLEDYFKYKFKGNKSDFDSMVNKLQELFYKDIKVLRYK